VDPQVVSDSLNSCLQCENDLARAYESSTTILIELKKDGKKSLGNEI
jgi:hypothetical protein